MTRFFLSLLFAILSLTIDAQAQGLPFPGPGMPASLPAIVTPTSLGCAAGTAASGSVTLTTLAAIPSGSLVVVGVIVGFSTAQTITGVSDGTNSYTQAVHSSWDATGDVVVDTWYKPNASAVSSSASLTATFSSTSLGATNVPVICAAVVSAGIIAAAPLDKTNTGKTNNGTVYASGATATLSQANEIAFGFLGFYNASATVTEGSGFTSIVSTLNNGGGHWSANLAYQIVAATTALNYQPSTSVNTFGAANLSTYKGF